MLESPPHIGDDPAVQSTLAAVDWGALSARACKLYGATSAEWCSLTAGGYNVVRFLQLDDHNSTIIVARVPYAPANHSISRRISSEVATMKYVAARTRIPVPHVLDYNSEGDGGGIGSPFILMTKVDGVPLSTLWGDMVDSKRKNVLRQVVDILLELSCHRFDKIGSLIQLEGQDDWVVDSLVCLDGLDDHIIRAITATPFTSGREYWVTYANAKLKAIEDDRVGSFSKIYGYANVWIMRSLIPVLYDSSLDESGFPLFPGDFHSQNIMITEVESIPRISAVIDWEFSSTQATSSFAQYPLFIIDHPHWPEDDPMRSRNVQDRMTFDTLLHDAESKASPDGGSRLSSAFASSKGVYLFEQLMQFPMFCDLLYPQLFDHIYGPGSKEFLSNYYTALIDNGLLKEVSKRFTLEAKVVKEATQFVKELDSPPYTRMAFVALARTHLDRFPEGGLVRKWLANVEN